MYSHQTATVKNIRHAEYFLRHSSQVGGPGHTVEIDEAAFGCRKNNRGYQVNTQWVFGGMSTLKMFFYPWRGEMRRLYFPSSRSMYCHGPLLYQICGGHIQQSDI